MSTGTRKTRRKDETGRKSPTAGAKAEIKKIEKEAKKELGKVEKVLKPKQGVDSGKAASHNKPSGRAPQALVMARHSREMKARPGRGFSLGEVAGAGLAPRLVAEWGASLDVRRRSVIEGNVGSLKKWAAPVGAGVKVEREVKRAEEKVVRAVEEVEEDMERGERTVKKEAKRAEKAIKEKAERTKARPSKKEKT